MTSICKLGEFIEKLDRPNSDLVYGIEDVAGITNTKQITVGTKANLIGRTFEKFTVLKPGEFIFNRRTSRNGERISLGYNQTDRNWILTEDYCHFKVREDMKAILDSDYLYLYFLRPEFDRYARFNSWGSATEFFNWEEMVEVPIPIISIEKQRKIVNNYKVVTDRIELLNKINENLDSQMSAVYHELFDNMSSYNEGTVGDFGDIISGATPSTDVPEYYCNNGIKWLSPVDLTSTGFHYIKTGTKDLTEDGFNSCSTRMLPKGTVLLTSRAPVGTVAIAEVEVCTNQGFKSIVPKKEIGTEYVYWFLRENKNLLVANATGTTFIEISGNVLKKLKTQIPVENLIRTFSETVKPMMEIQRACESEITVLSELQKTLLTDIAK